MDEKINIEEFWAKCLVYIKDRIQETAYQTWFYDVKVANITKDEVTLLVPNKFHYDWLESKYHNLIDDAIKSTLSYPLVVNYTIPVSSKTTTEIPSFDKKNNAKVLQNKYNHNSFNQRYTFETFIEGKDNQFAKAACYSVADTPGNTPFNPLLLYSETGLGKTHLLQAIGNLLLKRFPKFQITYLTSEKFMLEFISSIQKNQSTDFANKYRASDILLIDDVQFFESKEQTQEQFFHLFNALYEKGKQIVLTVDRHPNELHGIRDRLISRFQSGLIVDIQPPDFETRVAILMNDAEANNLQINYKITEFIASTIKNDIRKMKGVMVRLLAISSLKQIDVDMDLTKKVLKEMVGESVIENINIDTIMRLVASHMETPERHIRGKSRRKDIALARQIIMFISRELTSFPLATIGEKIGRRDHSTVVHACKNIENKMDKDLAFKTKIDELISKISNKT